MRRRRFVCSLPPVGSAAAQRLRGVSDREVADKAFAGETIEPVCYAELMLRGLAGAGKSIADTYALIAYRERKFRSESLRPM